MLVVRDDKSKSIFEHMVPQKGIDEKGFAASSPVEDVRWLGCSKLTLKSDNEPAVVKRLSEALNALRMREQRVHLSSWRNTLRSTTLRQTGPPRLE